MKITRKQGFITAALVGALTLTGAYAQTAAADDPTPGFNNKIPDKIE